MSISTAACCPDSCLLTRSWQDDGTPKEAVERHEWGVNGTFVKRYVRLVLGVAQKQDPCYTLKTHMHQLKFRISVFAARVINQKSETRGIQGS